MHHRRTEHTLRLEHAERARDGLGGLAGLRHLVAALSVLTAGMAGWGDGGATEPPAPEAGSALAAAEVTLPDPDGVTATGSVDPQVSAASEIAELVTAEATLEVASSEPLPSGYLLRTEVTESYAHQDGTTVTTPDYTTFIASYREPDVVEDERLRSRFPMRPRLLYGASELVEGVVRADVMPVTPFTGAVFGAAGGRLYAGGVEIVAASGDVERERAAELVPLDAASFASLLPEGFDAALAFELSIDGIAPGRHLHANFDPLAPNAHYVLARVVSIEGLFGLTPVKRFASDAVGNLVSAEPAP